MRVFILAFHKWSSWLRGLPLKGLIVNGIIMLLPSLNSE